MNNEEITIPKSVAITITNDIIEKPSFKPSFKKDIFLTCKCELCGIEFKKPSTKRGILKRFCGSVCSKKYNGKNNKGIKRSDDFVKKCSERMSGEGNHFYNKTHSEKSKKLISEKRKGVKKDYSNDISDKDKILNNIKINENGCWIWQGWFRTTGPLGNYGGIKVRGKSILAHRFSYTTFIDKIPNGYCVCHKCDIPSCVNPNHLFIGTTEDNMKDMAKKLRGTNGKGILSKLCEKDIIEIRLIGNHLEASQIAKMYNISLSTVYNIIKKLAWRHV